MDRGLIFPAVGVLLIGLLALGGMSPALLVSQLVFLGIGLLAFWFFSHFDYLNHQYLLKHYAVGGLVLLLLPFLFGIATRGAVRWIPLGSFTLQPSEIIKPFLILILAWFLSRSAPKVSGYQLIQSVVAVGSGGFLGRGLGHGFQSQLNFLPERQTDFVFATIAEELGTLGAGILLVL